MEGERHNLPLRDRAHLRELPPNVEFQGSPFVWKEPSRELDQAKDCATHLRPGLYLFWNRCTWGFTL